MDRLFFSCLISIIAFFPQFSGCASQLRPHENNIQKLEPNNGAAEREPARANEPLPASKKNIHASPLSTLCPSHLNSLEFVQPLPSQFKISIPGLSVWKNSTQGTNTQKALNNSPEIGVVIHGLNNPAKVMDTYAHLLNQKGLNVLRVALPGHRGDPQEQTVINRVQLLTSLQNHLCIAWQAAHKKKIVVIAYSLGALLSLDLLLGQPEMQKIVQKLVLVAPPLSLRWYTSLIGLLEWLGPNFFLWSANHNDYRHGNSTSMAAYGALRDSMKFVETYNFKTLKIPILTVLHENDELVDSINTAQTIKAHKLENWKMHWIDISQPRPSNDYMYHLMLDPTSLGATEWNRLKNRIFSFIAMKNLEE